MLISDFLIVPGWVYIAVITDLKQNIKQSDLNNSLLPIVVSIFLII